jgi:geranylgeranyl pyrophosphate synthase
VTTAPTAPFELVLEAGGERIRALMDAVESTLADASSGYGAVLERLAGDTLAAGGKRLRPLLVFVCAEPRAGEGADVALVRAGGAVELVHMATLVHDDVIDGAVVRRGRPTVFASEGRAAAAATGDFLFARAFALLTLTGDPAQVRTLSEACVALARGELAQRDDAYSADLDAERYLRRCRLKTASLFSAACRLGSRASGRGEHETEALGRFGDQLGLAFQLLDDVLDVAGDPERTGKQRGSDLLDGTVTLPLILARQSAAALAKLDLRSLDSRAAAERVCDRIAATDALDETRRRGRELVAAAKAELSGRVDAELASLLGLVADRVVDRET